MGNCVGVCHHNYLDEDYVAQRRYSSQKSAYPSTNAYDLDRRYKVWRTDGYYKIEEGSNVIVFRETAGVDLEAEIVADEYTSLTSFLAAIKTALEAAGVATYTVDTSGGKIRIASDLGGGATVFQLRMDDADSADMAEILGFDTVAYTGAATYTADVLRIHTEEWLEWDLGFPVNPKAFILGSDRNAALRLTNSCTVRLQGNMTRNWDSPSLDELITADDFYLAHWDIVNGIAGEGSDGYRYWRVQIIDKENTRQFVELGLAGLFDCIVPSRGAAVFPMEFQAEDPSNVVISEGGVAFGQELPNSANIALNWDALDKDEEQELRLFAERVKLTRSFFIILDAPEQSDGSGAFSANQREWVKLVKFAQNYTHRLASPNYWQGSWRLREVV